MFTQALRRLNTRILPQVAQSQLLQRQLVYGIASRRAFSTEDESKLNTSADSQASEMQEETPHEAEQHESVQ